MDISDAYVQVVIAEREAEFAAGIGRLGWLGRVGRYLLVGAAYVGANYFALSYAMELMAPRR